MNYQNMSKYDLIRELNMRDISISHLRKSLDDKFRDKYIVDGNSVVKLPRVEVGDIPSVIANMAQKIENLKEELKNRPTRGYPMTDIREKRVDIIAEIEVLQGYKLAYPHKRGYPQLLKLRDKLRGVV